MNDRDDEPTDLMDAVFRLDDLVEWLRADWPDEAAQLEATSRQRKGFIEIRLAGWPAAGETE